jgi:hypothetical protein
MPVSVPGGGGGGIVITPAGTSSVNVTAIVGVLADVGIVGVAVVAVLVVAKVHNWLRRAL